MRNSGGNAKGYELAGFADVFGRYLPADPSQPSQIKQDGPLLDSAPRHTLDVVTDLESGAKPYGADVVTGVTDREGEPGWEDVE